jgi:hypothetical protein
LKQRKDRVVGNGSIGTNADRRPAMGERRTQTKAGGSAVCGAMTEQHGHDDRGSESVPQKFVRLVGCHDPNLRRGRGIAAGLPTPGPKRRTD